MKQQHNFKGNCWAIPKDHNNDVVEVCKKHDEVRGDCGQCARCKWCDELERRAAKLRKKMKAAGYGN